MRFGHSSGMGLLCGPHQRAASRQIPPKLAPSAGSKGRKLHLYRPRFQSAMAADFGAARDFAFTPPGLPPDPAPSVWPGLSEQWRRPAPPWDSSWRALTRPPARPSPSGRQPLRHQYSPLDPPLEMHSVADLLRAAVDFYSLAMPTAPDNRFSRPISHLCGPYADP
jgi:hypothetical protein